MYVDEVKVQDGILIDSSSNYVIVDVSEAFLELSPEFSQLPVLKQTSLQIYYAF